MSTTTAVSNAALLQLTIELSAIERYFEVVHDYFVNNFYLSSLA